LEKSTDNKQRPTGRRRFFAVLGTFLGGLFAAKAARAAVAAIGNGDVNHGGLLTTHLRRGDPPSQPLDTMVLLERGDENDSEHPTTHEVLSLIHEEKGKRSYPWTLYSSLATHHEEGDGCVVCSRLHKHGPGWSSGLHSEVYSHGRSVALGVNIEMHCDYVGPDETEVIGLNIQPAGGPRPMQYAVQIQDGEGRFEKGIGLNGQGEVGVDMRGHYGIGLNAHANSIRVSEGTCIELEQTGRIRVRYRAGRIEFLNGEKCFGHLDVNGEDHAI
jgi:hypothetical protein